MAGSPSASPSSSRRRSLRRMAAAFRRLIDEEEEEEGSEGEASSPGEEGKNAIEIVSVHPPSSLDLGPSCLQTSHITQMREEFFIPDSQIIYTPGPQARAPFPPANYLAFFLAQVQAGLRFPIHSFYQEVAQLFQVPLNQLVPNSFRIMASFYMVFRFNGYPVSAQVFSQYFYLKTASRGFFLLTPRPGVSFLPAPNAPKNGRGGSFSRCPPGPAAFTAGLMRFLPLCMSRRGIRPWPPLSTS
ncbi:UNVERIFIED_CONTAM: hypothetical protein Slati_3108200 [Sesamum latifolium]|uniref:Transposase (putative) gypsy type domain-containing protein n=1 Tax=Sesamum latifolium TaxID=2727402 RepID=A0AAW2UVG2_9LAMI